MRSHEAISNDAENVEVEQKVHLDCSVVSRDQYDEHKEPSFEKVDWVVEKGYFASLFQSDILIKLFVFGDKLIMVWNLICINPNE